MKKYLIIFITFVSFYKNLNAQSEFTITGKIIFEDTEELLPGVNVNTTNCNSTIGAVTQIDGTFNFKSKCKPDTIIISYIGCQTKKIKANFDASNKLVINTFLSTKKLIWEKESTEYRNHLSGGWMLKKFILDNRRYSISKKIRKGYGLRFKKEQYNSLQYGELSYGDGCNGTFGVYYRFTGTDEIEFKYTLLKTTLIGCRYQSKKHKHFHIKYHQVVGEIIDKIVQYRLKGRKLYLQFGNNQLILEKS